jgi:hypothetical protein
MMYEIGLCPDWGRVDDYYMRYILERGQVTDEIWLKCDVANEDLVTLGNSAKRCYCKSGL